MDLSELDQADRSSPETSDSSLSPDPPNSNGIFGEPLVHPRVGDEYQVEIPSLLNKSEPQLMMNLSDSEHVMDSSHSFLIGLPLPLMWISNHANLIKQSVKPLDNRREIYTNGLTESENNVEMNNISVAEEEPNVKVGAPNQTYFLVPGQASAPWSDFEADCFLLGLYIFGKNFVQVMKFMESKGLGKILAYYYGRFYGSIEYHRWAECRKMRNRKCVPGHRFFTGYRQNELFVRLAPRLSEEYKTKFLEVCRAFVEERISLEEYVSSLKTLVGIHALLEAVGIGKGKHDLTTLILDGAKNSQLFTHRPEIPSGKACSSLSCAEIVNYLTGNFRLSKARSNDLFWEAVWPRLLARGWHSEQPYGDNYAGSKNSLVFLMPGVRKFSPKKLSKGDHYFDSISDVLAKVASEPELLEMEADETTPSSSKIENGWIVELSSDDDPEWSESSDQEQHCYLKPRVPSEASNLFKFTVVDTSLANEDNPFKVRVLRSLPFEAKRCSSFRKTDKFEIHADLIRNGLNSLSHLRVMKANGASEKMSASHGQRSRTLKLQFTRRIKHGLSSCSTGQAMKRRRLASCVGEEVTCVLALPASTSKTKNKSKNVNASKPMMTNNVLPSRVTQSNDAKVISTKSLAEGDTDEKIFQGKSLTNFSSDVSQEKVNPVQEPEVFDLNLPLVEPESNGTTKLGVEPRSDDKVKPEAENKSDDKVTRGEKSSVLELAESKNLEHCKVEDQLVSCVPVDPTNKGGDMLDHQQPRRQSTRNRPLTTKALEALEIGFLNPVRHSRKRSASLQEQKPKRSCQPRGKSSKFREATDENCNGKLPETLGNAISVQKAAMSSDLFGLQETSFAPTASSKEMIT